MRPSVTKPFALTLNNLMRKRVYRFVPDEPVAPIDIPTPSAGSTPFSSRIALEEDHSSVLGKAWPCGKSSAINAPTLGE